MRQHHRISWFSILFLAFVGLAIGPGCGGGGGGGTGQLALSVTDAPFPLIDGCLSAAIIQIDEVSARGSEAGWVDVPLEGAVGGNVEIDLLDLRAGLSDSLALGSVPTGAYSEVRLHIVEARLEFTDGTPSQSFKVPSGMSSGLKLKIDPPVLLAAGATANLMLDVDVSESFHTTGLGGSPTCDELKQGETMVIFSPVVRVLNTDTTGLVTGIVKDDVDAPQGDVEVTAFPLDAPVDADTDPVAMTFSTPAGVDGVAEGAYALWLEPGTYDLYVRAQGVDERTKASAGVVVTTGAILAGEDLVLPAPSAP